MLVWVAGPPGAGKTTLLETASAATGITLISRDLIRAACFPGPGRHTAAQTRLAFAAMLLAAQSRLRRGGRVALDGCCFARQEQRDGARALASRTGATLVTVRLELPIAEAVRRVGRDGAHPAKDRDAELVARVAGDLAAAEAAELVIDATQPPAELVIDATQPPAEVWAALRRRLAAAAAPPAAAPRVARAAPRAPARRRPAPRHGARWPGRHRSTPGSYDRALATARTSPAAGEDQPSFYEAVGGEPTFRMIVARFYAEVARDEVLRPLYPEADLGAAEERLRLFLIQYWGGPQTYGRQRGHPRLRMRHAPFRIGASERDAWLRAMRIAVTEAALAPAAHERLMSYLEMTAQHMVNSPG